MIAQEPQRQNNDIFNQVAIELDIPPHKYAEAMDRFDAIKRHLEEGNYPGSMSPPEVYLQGSFRLGTVIRPVKGGKDFGFDIDIVCEVSREKDDDDPEDLKNDVGEEVKGYAKKNNMERPKNARRCWALNYASDSEGIGFHVDILPCLPDAEAGGHISRANFSRDATHWQYTKTTIALTNRDDVSPPEHDWRSSNPIGFARWFKDICDPGYATVDDLRQKMLLFESYGQRQSFPYDRPEDIPDELVRTPLQRAIQIMKRHRDIRFRQLPEEEHKPISMIITTLAARLYEGRASQYQTTREVLEFIVDKLAQHAALVDNQVLLEEIGNLQLIQRVDDTWYIPNPVNPHNPGDPAEKGENFADRWHEDDHAKAKAFFRWIEWLRADLDSLIKSRLADADMEKTLVEAFGDDIATRTLSRLGIERQPSGLDTTTRVGSTTPACFNVPHREQPKWPVGQTDSSHVSINGKVRRQKQWVRFRSDCAPLPKSCDLMFTADTNVLPPFNVYWQVVNTGAEAESHGPRGLRGQIHPAKTAGIGGLQQKEYTEYTGMHWVECFIVKDEVLVARSGEFVVNIE